MKNVHEFYNYRQMKDIKNIMIIDDDPINNIIARHTIRHFDSTIVIDDYSDPEKALNYLETQSKSRNQRLPDIIFLDLNMPFIDGWTFLESYKNLLPFFNKHVDLFLLTSSTNHKDMQRAKSFPIVSNYISKPLNLNILEKIRTDLG
ncbi:MAG: response regulator [Bacteroidetes bacterium]|nr:MAG: response regulator [Bacteroidota bacterium]